MKSISITEAVSGVNGVRYLNLLLLIAAVFVLALVVREYLSEETVSGHMPGGEATALRGKADKRGFSQNAVIGSSGILGAPTVLSLIRSAPVQRPGAGPVRTTATSSQFTLLGTVTDTGGGGFAIFTEKSSGKEEVVRRGESVFTLGKLVRVERYRAVVESGGREMIFNMDLSDKERAMGENAHSPMRGGGSLFFPGGLNPFTGRPANRLAKPLGKGRWLVDRRALDSALKDSNRVLADARFYPYREGGVVKGYLISQVRPSGVFYGMGMRSGDIILSVNDYVIDAPEKAMSLMKGLKGETNVKLDILRRGRAQTFKYEIR